MNFRNFGNEPSAELVAGGGGRSPGIFPLARQSSVYSLTFDEFQSTIGGSGKDFGSMNMDELLKNIWSAEETQTVGSTSIGQEGVAPGGYLQRQGSLTLPRTLSQKTVDEVWRDLAKESGGGTDRNSAGGTNPPQAQRQRTLGEMTLEEFLVRAGVVREDAQLPMKPNNSGFFSDLMGSGNNNGVGIGFQQMGRNTGLAGNRIPEVNNQTSMQSANLPLNVNGVRSSQQQLFMPQQQQQQQQQQQLLFPKQPTLAYANPMPIPSSTQLNSQVIRGGIVGITDQSMNGNMVQSGALQGGGMGMIGFGAGAVTVATGSPASDGLARSNGDTSSVSPVPYVFNGGLRGRKGNNPVEKVVERRQRRMIKNRESAARSRARKQAYTTELEVEIAKLKEENEVLRKKQEEILEMRKNQVLEMTNKQQGVKKRCLRRTQTGPW
ncbi:bZIP transcription factor TRAB1-like [Actinidia eriantha]|uniref:bZIP transcription factor TRAB1-like n=1 Tax=Actinidia eriantha TaxID=165200 RepID=UPI002587ED11|nr:bZIP transcription factor TRAB1-like [Actinidia eriantha]XP_057505207.1 bZIP transcription factor TRAB1-like [Actinidia eriantha]